MSKILITGASGFLGQACLEALKNSEHEVFAVFNKRKGRIHPKINWVKSDLHQQSQVDKLLKETKPEYLLHLAWEMEPGMKIDSSVHFPWVDTSMDLIQRFADNGGKRVFISGSCAEYKWGKYLYDEEKTPIQPENSYGLSKHELHQRVTTFCSQGNLSYAWGRIFFMYGPNENKKRLVPHVIHSILKGEKVQTTHGNQVYDYLYVQDVVEALISLTDSDYNGAVNICSGKPIKLRDIILKIATHMNGEHLIEMGALKTNSKTPEYVVGNNNRLQEITNWEQKTDIDAGLKKTIEFIKNKTI